MVSNTSKSKHTAIRYAGTWLNFPLALVGSTLLLPVWSYNAVVAKMSGCTIWIKQNKVDAFGRNVGLHKFNKGILRSSAQLIDVLFYKLSLVGVPVTHRLQYESQQQLAEHYKAPTGIYCDFDNQAAVGLKENEKHVVLEQQLKGSSLHFLTTFLKGLFIQLFFPIDKKNKTPKVAKLFGLPINNVQMQEAIEWVCSQQQTVTSSNNKIAFFVNAHSVNLSAKSNKFKQQLLLASRLFADGSGMRLAAQFNGIHLQANINGTDMLPKLCEKAASAKQSIFLLGGKPNVAIKAAKNLTSTYQELQIAGCEDGFFDKDNEQVNEELIQKINDSGADILLVGLGSPVQETWCLKNAQQLNCKRILAVGGLFDYFSGSIARAPAWMRELGLEWIWRLIQEPKTKFSRYVIGTPEFLFRLLFNKLSNQ